MSFVKRNFKDVDDSMITIYKQINDYINGGNIINANAVAKRNVNIIGDRPNADFFNAFEDEIVNVEEKIFAKKTFIYNTEEIPVAIEVGQSWIGGNL